MRTKWYICTLFLIVAFFGAFQEKNTLPNQEIVLEFVDTTIKQDKIASTIANIKEKLLITGVQNITIQKTNTNTLVISYYSLVNIENIKAVFKESKLLANQTPLEKKQNDSEYNVNVYELSSTKSTSKPNDNCIFEVKFNSERFITSHSSIVLRISEINTANQFFKTKYKANKNKEFTQEQTSHTEPEVRAGPVTHTS